MDNNIHFEHQESIFEDSYDGFVFNVLEKKEILFKEYFDEDDDEDDDDDDDYREYARLKIHGTKKIICLNNNLLYPPK